MQFKGVVNACSPNLKSLKKTLCIRITNFQALLLNSRFSKGMMTLV